MTLRLSDEQDRAFEALARAGGIRKQEAAARAIADAAARRGHEDQVRAMSSAARERYGNLLERLGR